MIDRHNLIEPFALFVSAEAYPELKSDIERMFRDGALWCLANCKGRFSIDPHQSVSEGFRFTEWSDEGAFNEWMAENQE